MKMDKVIVKLYVPIIEKQYDIKIPINRKIYNVVELLSKAIYELNDGNYRLDIPHYLYDKASAEQYNMNLIVAETNIRNGKEIILI